jgi:hypothetical protein
VKGLRKIVGRSLYNLSVYMQVSDISRYETVTAFNIYVLIISITQKYMDEVFLYRIIINSVSIYLLFTEI